MEIAPKFRNTAFLRAFSLLKIPMLFFVGPVVEELTEERCVVRIPLNFRTKNHLGSMYFGVLCTGADCAAGLIAMKDIRTSSVPIQLVFKNFEAKFLKRAQGDVYFVCDIGREVKALVVKAINSEERQELPVPVKAYVDRAGEPVAEFVLTLSLKRK